MNTKKDFSIFTPRNKKGVNQSLSSLKIGDQVCIMRGEKIEYWQVRGFGSGSEGVWNLNLTPYGKLEKEEKARNK